MSLHSLAPPGGPQSLRTRYTNCLDPGNNRGIRNVSLPFNDVNESERTVCTAALMCLEHVSYPSGMRGGDGGRRRKGRGDRSADIYFICTTFSA